MRIKDITEDVQSYNRGVSSCCNGRGLRGVRTCDGAVRAVGASDQVGEGKEGGVVIHFEIIICINHPQDDG